MPSKADPGGRDGAARVVTWPRNRRFTRLTSAFSKKVENHAAMVSLHLLHHNVARPHSALGKNRTPAMTAGVADHIWTCEEIAALID